jgi:vitamin B12 transporter
MAGSIGGSSTTILANPDIKPQTGIHYELGWKKQAGAHNWKVALFNEYIEDDISAYSLE